MERGRRKLLNSLNNQYRNQIIMYYITVICGGIGIIMYLIGYDARHTGENLAGWLMGSVIGWYVIVLSCANCVEYGITENRRKKSSENGNLNGYSIYAILPVRRKEIFECDFFNWRIQSVVLAIGLCGMNIIYLYNDVLHGMAGFFVIITMVSVAGEIVGFASRYFNKKWGLCNIAVIFIYIGMIFLNIFAMGIPAVMRFATYFLGMDLFEYAAGVPMLILSSLFFPVLLYIFKKHVCDSRKKCAWYC